MTTAANTANKPMIATREVITSSPWASWIKDRMSPELRAKMFAPLWPEWRVRRHLEMLRAFGFNSIQVSVPTQAMWVGGDMESWRTRQRWMLTIARELGMGTAQFVWGAAIGDPAVAGRKMLQGQQVAEMDWHEPDDRDRLLDWYDREAELAELVDRVVTHWIDPGRPQRGGVDTVVELHNTIVERFRRRNPRLRGALSTWFMPTAYPDFESPGALAAHRNLEPDSDVTIGLMNYGADGVNRDHAGQLDAAELRAIGESGRRAGVWAWYTTDNEINPALHVRTQALENYFRNLPANAVREHLAWHNVDDNFCGLNMQNLFVAGRLMQDPAQDAAALLAEFARGFVGERDAPALVQAWRAIELARTRSMNYHVRIEDTIAPETGDRDDRVPLPPDWLEQAAGATTAARAAVSKIGVPPQHQPPWPVTLEPADYLAELQAHLAAIERMLDFLREAENVRQMHRRGASAERLHASLDALPRLEYDGAHTAGLEAAVSKQKRAELEHLAGGP